MQNYGAPIKRDEPKVIPMEIMFEAYCRMDPISDAKGVNHLPLSQLEKWLVASRVLDMSRVTTTHIGLGFLKFRKRAITYDEFLEFLRDLTSSRGLDHESTTMKMQTSGIPVHPREIAMIDTKK